MKVIDTMIRTYDARLEAKTPCTNKPNQMTIAQWADLGIVIRVPTR